METYAKVAIVNNFVDTAICQGSYDGTTYDEHAALEFHVMAQDALYVIGLMLCSRCGQPLSQAIGMVPAMDVAGQPIMKDAETVLSVVEQRHIARRQAEEGEEAEDSIILHTWPVREEDK